MTNQALVSIVMPAFNAEAFIDQAVASVVSQTTGDWELLVIDDGSTDSTRERVLIWQERDPRISLTTQQNAGPAMARNSALNRAKGRYISFLDSDDVWLPSKLERQITLMREQSWALSFTQYRCFRSEPEDCGPLVPVPPEVTYRKLLSRNVIGMSTAVVDRHITGAFSLRTQGHEDFLLWLDLLKRGFVARGIQEDLVRYRLRAHSLSSSKLRAARWVWDIYRTRERLGWADSSWQFAQYVFKAGSAHFRKARI